MPKSDSEKKSLPGEFRVIRDLHKNFGVPMVYPAESDVIGNDEFKLVYDNGKVCAWDDFETIKERVESQFNKLPAIANPISPALSEKQALVENAQRDVNVAMDT